MTSLSRKRILAFIVLVALLPFLTGATIVIRGPRVPASAGGFSPSDIAGLLAWYDAEDLALANDALVSSWTDLSGNAAHATTGPGGGDAVYKTNITSNGKAVVRFDGVNDYLRATIGSRTAQTWFIVAKRANTTNSVLLAVDGAAQIYSDATNAAWWAPSTAFAGDITAGFLILVVKSSSTSTATLYNGNTAGTTFDPNDAITGTTLDIGAYNGGAYAAVDVAAVLVYNSALSDTDREDVANYLGTRYGITP